MNSKTLPFFINDLIGDFLIIGYFLMVIAIFIILYLIMPIIPNFISLHAYILSKRRKFQKSKYLLIIPILKFFLFWIMFQVNSLRSYKECSIKFVKIFTISKFSRSYTSMTFLKDIATKFSSLLT